MTVGTRLGLTPRDVFDMTPASFSNFVDSSVPDDARIMSRRLMLNMMREVDGKP